MCVVCRPYVVSVRWLVDCLKQSRTVKEDEYICYTSDAVAADKSSSNASVSSLSCKPLRAG